MSNTAPASPGLVAAYGFDETSGSIVGDSSGNSNAGSITSAARIVAGKYGGALSFNGSSNLVSVPDSNSLDLTSGMTLEAWVRPTTLGAFETVVLKEAPGDVSYGMYASSAYGGSGVSRPSAWIGGTDVGATTALSTGAWSHLAATYDRTSFKLYINGTQVASKAFTGAIPRLYGRAEDRWQLDLGRVLQRPDRRDPGLQPRVEPLRNRRRPGRPDLRRVPTAAK